MADYRPMPRGAYDANGRPIGRWPEPPEPVAPRQDLLPTPAPAPAPVQRTSPGGVGWLPNKQERDMMQDLYPESTQRPPTRLEKFFQWLSGSSDAGASVNYDPNARGFALQDATIPTAAVTNTSTATLPANPETGVLSYPIQEWAPVSGPRGSLPIDRAALYERSMNQVGGQPEAGVRAANRPYEDAAVTRDAGADTLYPSNRSSFLSGDRVPPIYGDAKPGGPSQSATAGAYLSAEIGGRPTPVSDAMYRHLGIVPPSPQNTYESYPDHFYVPGGRIGAPPPAPVTTSPEIAVPYAGGTYYRNDSSGVPVLSNVPGGTSGIGFNSAPAYAMGTTLAAQRPDIYNPDGTPRQTTFGGQAVDPGLADTVATVSQITKDMQALNPRGGPPRIVGEEDPFDAAIRSVRSSGLSKNTQAKYIADITQQRANASQAAARDATSLAVARIGADSANARLAAEDKREADRLDLGRAKLAADVAGRGRVTTEEVPVVFGKIAGNPTKGNETGIIHTAVQGKYVGSGITPEAASAALRANITADINRYFDAAMSKPGERAKLEAEFGTSDEAKLREEYLLRAYRQRTTRQRTTQPTTGIGGTSLEE